MAKVRKKKFRGWLKPGKKYSASAIRTFLNCELQSYYDKIHQPRLIVPTHLEYVRGNVLHEMMAKFYKPGGTPKYAPYNKKKANLILNEDNVETLEKYAGEFVAEELPKHGKLRKPERLNLIMKHLADTYPDQDIPVKKRVWNEEEEKWEKRTQHLIFGQPFANVARNRMGMILNEKNYRNQDIDFSKIEKSGQDIEEAKQWLKGEVYNIAKQCYRTYWKEEPPVFAEKKINFCVVKKGKPIDFIAIIDEIRYPLTVRDHKSAWWLPEAKNDISLEHNIQFSLYAIALSIGCSTNKEFALKCGATEEDFEHLKKDYLYLLPKIKVQHHHMRKGIITEIEKPRTKTDFRKLVDTTVYIEKKLDEYKKGKKHFLEIFTNKWGVHRHHDIVKACGNCDYKELHRRDQEDYEAGHKIRHCSIENLIKGNISAENKNNCAEQLEFGLKF